MDDMEAVKTDANEEILRDSRILVLDHALWKNDPHKGTDDALFIIGCACDGNWNVIAIPQHHDGIIDYRANFPETWRGLSNEELSKKISDYSAICKFGELGFLEGKLPSDFKDLSESGCWFTDEALKALSINDAISCDADGVVLTVKSKKSAIRAAEVASDYAITRDKK